MNMIFLSNVVCTANTCLAFSFMLINACWTQEFHPVTIELGKSTPNWFVDWSRDPPEA